MADNLLSKKWLLLALVVVIVIFIPGTIFHPYLSSVMKYHKVKPTSNVSSLIPDATSNQTVVDSPKKIVVPLMLLTLPSIANKPCKPNALVILIVKSTYR